MASKTKTAVEATREWFFPALGKTVSAPTYEEALASLEVEEKAREEGDGNS